MKRYGLHIGINRVNSAHYGPAFPTLRGAVNDAVALQQALQPLGYEQPMMVLTDQNATTTHLKTQLSHLAGQLVSGDLLVITYSGHGSQLVDSQGIEPDHLNEVFVFWDRFLIDDELRRLFALFARGVQIVVVSDSCNSGTSIELFMLPNGPIEPPDETTELEMPVSMRATQPTALRRKRNEQSRLISWQVAMEIAGQHRDVYDPIMRLPPLPESALKATVLLLSACSDIEEAHEKPDGQHGWFTFRLLGLIKSGLPANYPALRQQLATLTAQNGQTPQLLINGPNKPVLANRSPFL